MLFQQQHEIILFFPSLSDFLGRTEVPVATIKKDTEGKGAATRRLLLHEVPTGEVSVKLDLQLYEPSKWAPTVRFILF